MFGAFNIFSVSVFDNIMNRPRNEAQPGNTASHLNEIYPDLRNDRAVLNVELPDRTTIPPLYSRVNTCKVRTFGAYPAAESSRLKANLEEYRSMKEYV